MKFPFFTFYKILVTSLPSLCEISSQRNNAQQSDIFPGLLKSMVLEVSLCSGLHCKLGKERWRKEVQMHTPRILSK